MPATCPYPEPARSSPHPSHSSRCYHPHNIVWAVQIIKIYIMQFSPLPCYLVHLWLKYYPQHPILKHPLPMFLPQVPPDQDYIYTGCNRRNGPDFGRAFLMLNYTDITQNTYIQSWTVTEIMTIEMCGILGCRRTVRRPWRHTCPLRTPAQDMVMQSAYGSSDVTR